MPLNTNPVFIGTKKTWMVELDNADGTNLVSVVAAGANGSLIEALGGTTDDTSAVEVELFINDGTNDFQLGSFTVTAGAGTDGGTTPSVDGLQQTDLPWLRDDLALPLENGMTLKAAANSAISAGKVVHLHAYGGDY